MGDLTTADLRDSIQRFINATSFWYGTSDSVKPGKALISEASTPPFVIVHPDDVDKLPVGAHHLREYRPTQADIVKMMEEWRAQQPVMDFLKEPEEEVQWIMRRRWGI